MKNTDENLDNIIKDMAITLGACRVGITTRDSLKNWHSTTDLDYILEGAESAVTFAVPFEEEDPGSTIDMFLKKEDQKRLEKQKVRATTLANGIALEISGLLNQIGFKTEPVHSNFVYRKESPSEYRVPPLSHKLLAFKGGVGHIGHSGLIITKEHGPNIALASVVTQAKLNPTEPLPEEENYCDNCKLCSKVCLGDYMTCEEYEDEIEGIKYKSAQKAHPMRCSYVCTGSTGYNDGNWSTWSPARFSIPKSDEELIEIFQQKAIPAQTERNQNHKIEGGFFHPFYPGFKIEYSCSLCQFICHPSREVRMDRYKKLVKSGVIIEKDGKKIAVNPDEAEKLLETMPISKKKMYTEE